MATSKSSALSGDKAQAGISLGCVGRRLSGEELSMGGTARTITRRTARRSECESARTPRPPTTVSAEPQPPLRNGEAPSQDDTAERMSELVIPPHDGEDDSDSTGSDNRRYPSHERVHDLPRRAARLPGCAAGAGLYIVCRAAAQHHTAQEVGYSGGREACILYWET